MRSWSVRASQVAARYGEHTPAAAACCNVCRTCVTTNVAGVVAGAVVAAAVAVRRLFRA